MPANAKSISCSAEAAIGTLLTFVRYRSMSVYLGETDIAAEGENRTLPPRR
jgi:hypothetical protein